MGNTKGFTMLIIATFAAVLAVVMASKWLTQRANNVNKIAVVAREINLGQKLNPDMLKLVDWPANSIPPDTFNDLAILNGRVTKVSLQVGEPIMGSKLAPIGTQGGLSAVIAEGKRAITVRVNDVVGVAGFALPGNFVDIIVHTQKDIGKNNDRQSQDISKIVLDHILVLAVAQEVGRDETKPKVVNAVTLEVTPQQAEMIDLARSVGELSLVLRNQSDPENSETIGVTKNSLLDIQPEIVPVVTSEKPTQKSMQKPAKLIKKIKLTLRPAPEPVFLVQKKCTKVITGLTETLECF